MPGPVSAIRTSTPSRPPACARAIFTRNVPPHRRHGVMRILHNVDKGLLAQSFIHRHGRQIRFILLLHANRRALP